MSLFAGMMVIALVLDAALGWPDALYRRLGHPVTWIGALVDAAEVPLNRGEARVAKGALTVAAVCLAALIPTLVVQMLLPAGWMGAALGGVLAWPLVATRSLYSHVAAVAEPLARNDLDGARREVAMIVGRDPSRLNTHGVARAAIESLAENASDGVTAPLFWGAVFGLPGLAVYKAINTMDSMIGHRNARFEAFGKVAARLDDFVNLVPARLTGALFALVSAAPRRAWRVMWQDARQHRSPNAGWPEGAMAGALDVRLSGPRQYADHVADEPWVNEGARDPDARDIRAGLRLYLWAMGVLALILTVLALA